MNIFEKIFVGDRAAERRLGNPSADYAAQQRRLNVMATMTGSDGFRIPPMQPRVNADGTTRGQRKAKARARLIEKETARQKAEAEKLIAAGLSKAAAYSRFGSLTEGRSNG